MERFHFEQHLPSCKVSKELIKRLESQLLLKLPKLLKSNMASMMEVLNLKSPEALVKYGVLLEDREGVKEIGSIAEYRQEKFHHSLKRIELQFRLGRPEILSVRFRFARDERPLLELSTVSRQVKDLCPGIAEGLAGVVDAWANRHRLAHSPLVQLLVALALPAALVGIGHLRGVDPFMLYASMGWLVLLAGGLSMSLPRLFPYVTFQVGRHLSWRQALLFGFCGLNVAAISGYVDLLIRELKLL